MLIEINRVATAVLPGSTDDESSDATGRFTLVPRAPFVVKAGSQLTLQDACIEVRRPAGSILIREDITISPTLVPWVTQGNNIHYASGQDKDPRNRLWVRHNGNIVRLQPSVVLRAGSYDPAGLCAELTDLFSACGPQNPQEIVGSATNMSILVRDMAQYDLIHRATPGGTSFTKIGTLGETDTSYASLWIGSPTLAFDIDPLQGRARLSYSHSPCLNQAGDEVGVVRGFGPPPPGAPIGVASGRLMQTDRTGTVIQSLGFGTTRGEWETPSNPFYLLGFAREDLEIPVGQSIEDNYLNPQDCPSFTTTELIAEALYTPDEAIHVNLWGLHDLADIALKNSAARLASGWPSGFGQGGPRLLIECSLVPPNTLCSDGVVRPVVGVVTADFQAAQSLWSTSSNQYTFTEDTTVSAINVAVLDPTDEYRAAPLGLGTSILLSIQEPTALVAGEPSNSEGEETKK